MVYRKGPLAFVAFPSEDVGSEVRDTIEDTLREKEIELTSANEGELGDALTSTLWEADFVIADITSSDPNVLVEVGMALGMRKPLLLLSQSRSMELPHDLAAHQVAVYRPDDVGPLRKYVESWLRDAMRERDLA